MIALDKKMKTILKIRFNNMVNFAASQVLPPPDRGIYGEGSSSYLFFPLKQNRRGRFPSPVSALKSDE